MCSVKQNQARCVKYTSNNTILWSPYEYQFAKCVYNITSSLSQIRVVHWNQPTKHAIIPGMYESWRELLCDFDKCEELEDGVCIH